MNERITISGPKVANSSLGKVVTHNLICDGKCIGTINISDRVSVIIGTAHYPEALSSFQVRQIFDLMVEFERANEVEIP